ncbi:MAG: hypothetical protein ACP5QA_16855 [Phycisphaerae bacterium]
MTYRGRVRGGVVVLENPTAFAEGTEVDVEAVGEAKQTTWAHVWKDVIGKAEGLPPDSSRNHDHHLYDTGKR